MALSLDPGIAFEARVLNQIASEEIGWLTTVNGDNAPQPNPVWFYWADGSFLILSKNNQAKLANIRNNSRVSLNLQSAEGNGVVIFTGQAEVIDSSTVLAEALNGLAAKYESGLKSLGFTREFFEQEYGSTIRFTPEKVRGW